MEHLYPYNAGNAKNVVQYNSDSEVAQILKLTNQHIDDVDFKKFDKKTFMFFKNKIDFTSLPDGTKFGSIIQKKEFSRSGKTSYNFGYFQSKEAINDCQIEKTIFSENEIYNPFFLIKLIPLEIKDDFFITDCNLPDDDDCYCLQCVKNHKIRFKESTLGNENTFYFYHKDEFSPFRKLPLSIIDKEIYLSVRLQYLHINLTKIEKFYENFLLIPKIKNISKSIKSKQYEIFIYDKDFNLSHTEVFDDSLCRIS